MSVAQIAGHTSTSHAAPEEGTMEAGLLSSRSLARFCFATAYSKGSVLFRAGERPQGILILASGTVKLSMSSAAGVTLVVRTAGPGEVLGLSAAVLGSAHQLTAETLEACEIKLIRREDFMLWLRRNPDATFRVVQQLASEYNATSQQIRFILLPLTATQRLAHLLLDLASRNGNSDHGQTRVHLLLTHQDIAQMIGASRETVTRLLALLRRKQLIQLKGSILLIPNKDALRNIENGGKVSVKR